MNDPPEKSGRTPIRRVPVVVHSRSSVRTAAPTVPYIVISITDPGMPQAELAQSDRLRGVLRLAFHDSGQEIDVPGLEGFRLSDDATVAMTRADADSIVGFVLDHVANCDIVLCQCEAGMSRSAGVAAALSQVLNRDDRFFFENYTPNLDVYRRVLEAAVRRGVI